MIGLAGALLVFTGLWHAFEWMMGGRNRDTLALVPMGIVYTVLGYLIVTFTGGETIQWIALLVTTFGLLLAVFFINKSQIRRWVMWSFIVIDLIIIVALSSRWFN